MEPTTIDDKPMFEAAGYKVYFMHMHTELPPIYAPLKPNQKRRRILIPAAQGGTSCHVVSETHGVTEVARCGMNDNFSRAKGRKAALRKLLIANFVRPQRAVFWYEYFLANDELWLALDVDRKWHVAPPTDEEVL